MTKEEFIEQLKELQYKRDMISAETNVLMDAYINSNRPCDINDAVKIEDRYGNILPGIVTGFNINFWKEIEPVVKKVKKDGTASTHNIFIYHDYKIHYPEKSSA